jgi:flagellar basal body-associated protein FliL
MRLQRANDRRGIILMVILAVLTLFALVGLTFVLYSDSEATTARIAREAETQ